MKQASVGSEEAAMTMLEQVGYKHGQNLVLLQGQCGAAINKKAKSYL